MNVGLRCAIAARHAGGQDKSPEVAARRSEERADAAGALGVHGGDQAEREIRQHAQHAEARTEEHAGEQNEEHLQRERNWAEERYRHERADGGEGGEQACVGEVARG